MKQTRRKFLIDSGCALSMTALAAQSEYFGLMNALAQKSESSDAIGGIPSDYRALVCIFMTGGNDGNNTVIPNHNDASVSGYPAYSAARSSQGLPCSKLSTADRRSAHRWIELRPASGFRNRRGRHQPGLASPMGTAETCDRYECWDSRSALNARAISDGQCSAAAATFFAHGPDKSASERPS